MGSPALPFGNRLIRNVHLCGKLFLRHVLLQAEIPDLFSNVHTKPPCHPLRTVYHTTGGGAITGYGKNRSTAHGRHAGIASEKTAQRSPLCTALPVQ